VISLFKGILQMVNLLAQLSDAILDNLLPLLLSFSRAAQSISAISRSPSVPELVPSVTRGLTLVRLAATTAMWPLELGGPAAISK
jgi:hypothetical protein